MKEHDSKSRSTVNRREFLGLVGSGVAFAVTSGIVPEHVEAELHSQAGASGASAAANALAKPGPIAQEHFEAARKRAADLVARMTLKEKVSQFGHSVPAIPRLKMPAFNYYASEALHGLIHEGPVTSFPLPLALGCSWNPALIRRVFDAVSDEIWAWHKKSGQGLAMFSPPTVNMGTRDPRWGRIGENYSEDPLLVSKLAVEAVRGMQGDDPRYLKSVACAKHFVANDTEDDRTSTSATVDARSFYEYYTRGFEACVREGGSFTVMSSYNSMNGIPTTASAFLLTQLLRERWGFQGYVVSDCDAIGDIMRTHHFVPTYAEASALAVNAGCDINCGGTLPHYLGEAVDKMLISEETIDGSLTRSITGRILMGDLDPMEQSPYSKIPVSCLESAEHQELCREAGRQSIVLFKNENNTLPLRAQGLQKLAVIGPMAGTCQLGNYSGKPLQKVSPLDGILKRFGVEAPAPLPEPQEKSVQGQKGAKYTGPASLAFTGGTTHVAYAIGCTVAGEKDDALMQAAVDAAKGADAVLVFVGADEEIDREGHDRDFLHLPGVQHELVQAVYAANPKTVLVISSNCPVAVVWEQENLPAIVGGVFLGGQQGDALADVIFGDYNPGGKVSTTWYRHAAELPDLDSYNIRYGRTYLYYEGVPLYPFGHGLSYTKFDYSGMKVSGESLKPGGSVAIQMQVKNSGKREGDEIVQLYVRVSGGTVQRPVKQLVGFERVHLGAGESRTVQFKLAHEDRALSYWDEEKQAFVVEPGTVKLMVGASSADIRGAHEVKLEV